MELSKSVTDKAADPPRTVLIIISGPPASGKTYLGQRLATHFQWPFINKDGIKELLFEQLGWSNASWSRQLNAASLEVLYYFVRTQLSANRTLIVESNFKPEIDSAKFLSLKEQYQCEFIQIQCIARGEVLLERFQHRIRHPGHSDQEIAGYLEPLLLKGRQGNLEIGGHLIEVDTTYFEKINYPELYTALEEIINRQHQA